LGDRLCPIAAVAGAASQPFGWVWAVGHTLGVSENKSKVSYLSQFQLLNAIGSVVEPLSKRRNLPVSLVTPEDYCLRSR